MPCRPFALAALGLALNATAQAQDAPPAIKPGLWQVQTERDASAWKWRSTCTQPDSQSTGEARFDSAESDTITSDTTLTWRPAV